MKHGLYLVTKTAVETFENNWLDGRQVDLITTTFTSGFHDVVGITWEPGAGADVKRQSLQETFGDTSRKMLIGYEFAGEDRGNYEPAATGDLDAEYRQFANDLVSVGMGDSYIAPNHEFNLSWSSKYPNDPANYRDGYARFVREMQSVPNADFTFCYAPAQNRIGIADTAWPLQSTFWPDGEPEPVVTPSFYDAGGIYPEDSSSLTESELQALQEEAWNEKHEPTLQMWQDFANQRGADNGLREWGCATDGWANNSGLDNPMFINRMFDWMEQNDWLFQTYWNADSVGGGSHIIYPQSESNLIDAGDAWRERVLSDQNGGGSTDQYGGYTLPEAGATDWHIPLNENFTSIESDIEDLAKRIEELESS